MPTNSAAALLDTAGLLQALAATDPTGAYQQITYNRTTTNTLAPAWWVFMPYQSWSNYPDTAPSTSPLEAALIQAIDATSPTECFIDITYLAGSASSAETFFADTHAKTSTGVNDTVVKALVEFLGKLPATVTPVIRYLVGGAPNQQLSAATDGFVIALFKALGTADVSFPDAKLYYGNFSPIFEPLATTTAAPPKLHGLVSSVWTWLLQETQQISQEVYGVLQQLSVDTVLELVVLFLNALAAGTGNWNHSKIFALNGQTLVTGGANYWSRYATDNKSDESWRWLFDTSMTVTGGAAADAHRFADYLWTYLNALPTAAPLHSCVTALSGSAAVFSAANAPLYAGTPSYDGTLNVLSVGKSGLASCFVDEYPAQIIDALRDFLLNIVAAVDNDTAGSNGQVTAHLVQVLSDSNSSFCQQLASVGVNPASWASRYARAYAVGQATSSVRLTQQKLVMDDLYRASPDYQDLVAVINEVLQSTWDGYIWPFDLLFALGQALATMSSSAGAATGIEVVCSTRDVANGYEDPVSAAQFAQALTTMMQGMQANGVLDSQLDISAAISTYLHYKRIDQHATKSVHANHSKVVIIDDALLYVGSDNAYPSYNEEFGLWLDDADSIGAYLTGYWATLWQKAYPG